MNASRYRTRQSVSFLAACVAALVLAPVVAHAGSKKPDSPDNSKGYSYKTIVYDDFQKSGGYTLADYLTKWANPYGPGEMGVNETRNFTGGTFNIDAAPFQTGLDFSVFDHIKYLGVSQTAFAVPQDGSVEFSIDVNAETPGTQPGRIIHGSYVQGGAPYAEPTFEGQQAGATLHMIDFATGQLFDWFVAGHSAFTLIERLPTSVTGSSTPDYVGRDKMYTQILDEVQIKPGKHTVSIRYSRGPQGDRAEYFLDGKRVSQARNIGVPLDEQGVDFTGVYPSLGPGEPLKDVIQSVAIGNGLFSLLDAFPFQHPEAPELAVSIPLSERLFGQGARAHFDNVKVTIGEKRLKPDKDYLSPTNFGSLVSPPAATTRPGTEMLAAPAAGAQFAVSPNPTHGAVDVTFSLSREGRVELAVYDMQGRTVGTLANGTLAAGRHSLAWTGGSSAVPGVYYARLRTDEGTLVRRFAVIR